MEVDQLPSTTGLKSPTCGGGAPACGSGAIPAPGEGEGEGQKCQSKPNWEIRADRHNPTPTPGTRLRVAHRPNNRS
jgi:hypothetical protein